MGGWGNWLLILAGLAFLTALALFLAGGCANVERDMTVYGVWAKRGQVVGDLAHLYCEQGARRERDMMAWAIKRASYPAVVTITCTEEPVQPDD